MSEQKFVIPVSVKWKDWTESKIIAEISADDIQDAQWQVCHGVIESSIRKQHPEASSCRYELRRLRKPKT